MIDIDTYCIDRERVTAATKKILLNEVNELCPKCGALLISLNADVKNAQFEVAHIFPNSPTPHQRKILADVERLGANSEDIKNLIALCSRCHTNFDANMTAESYNKMLQLKKDFMSIQNSKYDLSATDIEKEIFEVIDSISNFSDDDLSGIAKMEYSALCIDQKIEGSYRPLRSKITGYVYEYFNIVNRELINIDKTKSKGFEIIAKEINLAYTKSAALSDNKEIIFSTLVDWLKTKSCGEITACEIIISYFIQNCQVYDKITK